MSKTLSTSKCVKLTSMYYESLIIVKCIDSSGYHLDPVDSLDVYLLFHVSHLKEFIGSNDNIVIVKSSVTHVDLSSKPHLLE